MISPTIWSSGPSAASLEISAIETLRQKDRFRATQHVVSLQVTEMLGIARANEPVTIGVPLSHGFAREDGGSSLTDANGRAVPVQSSVLARWPDQSIRWLSLTFLADVAARGTAEFQFAPRGQSETSPVRSTANSGERRSDTVEPPGVHIGLAHSATLFTVRPSPAHLVETARGDCRVVAHGAAGHREVGVVDEVVRLESGPVRWRWQLLGRIVGLRLRFTAIVSTFASNRLIGCQFTLENAARAKHQGGFWDLGDPASVLLRGLSLELDLDTDAGLGPKIAWCESPDRALRQGSTGAILIHQESSGGEAWQSRNHVDRTNEVPLRYRGYRVTCDGQHVEGHRARPVLVATSAGGSVGCALAEFWEKFPSGLECDDSALRAHILPTESGYLHEIQGGEHLSREIWFAFGADPERVREQLALACEPLAVAVDPQAVAASRALFCFPSPADVNRTEQQTLLQEALEGPNSFFAKREVIDDYGWRNYGDTWADHEQQYYDGPAPVISHYNNQYDLLYGLLVQYLMTSDIRWWRLADPLARHLLDIDIYHTVHDKAAYNGGLFWHTSHYHDVGTATHRSMSKQMLGKTMPAGGGGPGNEHNYGDGLMLYYCLTGHHSARAAVCQLADWVINMDDGIEHVLGLVSDQRTGFASSTGGRMYHGPGRGVGNSINALVNGWVLTQGACYLQKAQELIRRTIHPHDDLGPRDLGNSEDRWSVPVYLQALCRFLEFVPRECASPELHQYVRASVLHYARWMAEHALCNFDRPEKLEFPTETWAAQDLRKGNVLLLAARLTSGTERVRFEQRGREILDKAWAKLLSFPTRANTRPLALVLQQGYIETCLGGSGAESAPMDWDDEPEIFGELAQFTTQKQHVRRMLSSPSAVPGMILRLANPLRWRNAWRRSWWAQRLRNLSG